jgi:prevent-host-death family protein
MAMLKKISAMKARQNLGQLLNEVSIRGDSYIIERAGKPLAALVDMERFQQLQEDRSAALQALQKVWEKMAGADNQEIGDVIEEAVRTTRKVKAGAQA